MIRNLYRALGRSSLSTLFLLAGLLGVVLGPLHAQEEDEPLHLTVIAPGNEEVFYAGPLSYNVAVPVSGQVLGADGRPTDVDVELEIRSGGQRTALLRTTADEEGFFSFYLDLNPDQPQLPTAGARYFYYSEDCMTCHFRGEAPLPEGAVELVVTALDSGGAQSSVTRQVTVDRSQWATLPVRIQAPDGSALPVVGIPIQAETRLYQWRSRLFKDHTDSEGTAMLQVEALTQESTRYRIGLPPTVTEAGRYRTVSPVEVVLEPGARQSAPVTVVLEVERGVIRGRVQVPDDAPLHPLKVWAVSLPTGAFYEEECGTDGTFSFAGVPLGRYLLAAAAAGEVAFAKQLSRVDLTKSPAADVTLSARKPTERVLSGRVVDTAGATVPFVWTNGGEDVPELGASPLDGRFTIPTDRDGPQTVRFRAPGYWSRAVDLSNDGVPDVPLVPRPELRTLPWGDGQLVLPPETVVTAKEGFPLSLTKGWLWGHNSLPALLEIRLSSWQLTISAAEFALEFAPGDISWLYVTAGSVSFQDGDGATITVEAGEMLAFGQEVLNPQPVAAEAEVIALLRRNREPVAPLPFEEAPSAEERLLERLSDLGRYAGQMLVLGTYLLIIGLLAAIPLYFGYKRIRDQRTQQAKRNAGARGAKT